MRFASLGSGSKGNATLIAGSDTLLMVDCGFTFKDTVSRLARLGVSPEQLDAILVTHEHADHASGVAALSRRYALPVFLTHGTAASGKIDGAHRQVKINAGDSFSIGEIDIRSIAVPHDAREPIQFRLSFAGQCLGILTDLGSITPHVIDAYRGCTSLLLEFNHDVELLNGGPYPVALKRRVAGDFGHLNNHQAAQFLSALDTQHLRLIAIAHISEQNNTEERVQAALASVSSEHNADIFIACQQQGFDWLGVQSSAASGSSASG